MKPYPAEIELLEFLRGDGPFTLSVTRAAGGNVVVCTMPSQSDASQAIVGEGASVAEAWIKRARLPAGARG
jgi:hypothetical protein